MTLQTPTASFKAIFDRVYKLEQMVTSPEAMPTGGEGDSNFESITLTPPGGGTPITLDTSVPGLPTGLSATPGAFEETSFADLAWTAPVSPLAFSYQVEVSRKDTTAGTYSISEVRQTVGTSTRVEGLDAGVTYGFRVAGISRVGVLGAFSARTDFVAATDSTIPPAVTGLALFRAPSSIIATWNSSTAADVKDGHGLYVVQYSLSSTFASGVTEVRASGTVVSLSGINAESTYYVRVAAIDASGNQGGWSTTASVLAGGITSVMVLPGSIINTHVGFTIGGGNLLVNSGFENTDSYTSGWVVNIPANITEIAGRLSPSAVRLNSGVAVYQQPTLPTGTYVASVWMRANALTDSSYGLQVVVSGIPYNGAMAAGASGLTTGWVRISVVFNVPNDSSSVTVYLQRLGGGSGTLDFDDAQVEAGNVPTAYAPKVDEILPGVVGSDQLAVGSVITSKIAANQIVAGHIAARQISTDKLTVGPQGNNRVTNGDFEDLTYVQGSHTIPLGWGNLGSISAGSVITTPTGSGVGGLGKTLRLDPPATGDGVWVMNKGFPVIAGQSYFFQVRFLAESTVSSGIILNATIKSVPDNYLYTDVLQDITLISNVGATGGVWTTVEGKFTPTSSGYCCLRPHAWTGTAGVAVRWDEVVASKAGGTVTIANGAVVSDLIATDAIIASKIAADQITSGHIAAGQIVSSHITVGTLNGDRISVNTLDVSKLSASTLTSKTITIGAGGQLLVGTAPTGAGMLFNSQGISLYNSAGTRTVYLDATTGTATFTGTISGGTIVGTTNMASGSITGGTITGAAIQTASSGTRIVLGPASLVGSAAALALYSDRSGGDNAPAFIHPFHNTIGGVSTCLLRLQPGVPVSGHSIAQIDLRSAATFANTQVEITAGRIQIWGHITVDGNDNRFPNLVGTSGDVPVTRSAASGQLFYNVSSERFKDDIGTVESAYPLALIDKLEPISFKANVNRDAKPHKFVGLSAERTFGVAPFLVALDGEGSPISVLYDQVGVLALRGVQDLRERVAELEAIIGVS